MLKMVKKENENVIENVIEISETQIKKRMPEYSKKKIAKAYEIVKMISQNPHISIDEMKLQNLKVLFFTAGRGFILVENSLWVSPRW